jgi:hypothetical protein
MNVAQGMLRVNEISGAQATGLYGLAVIVAKILGQAADKNRLATNLPSLPTAAP